MIALLLACTEPTTSLELQVRAKESDGPCAEDCTLPTGGEVFFDAVLRLPMTEPDKVTEWSLQVDQGLPELTDVTLAFEDYDDDEHELRYRGKLAVPADTTQAWTAELSIDDLTADPVVVQWASPELVAELTCDAPCQVGAKALLRVSTTSELLDGVVVHTERTDGVPGAAVTGTQRLTHDEPVEIWLTAPASPARWSVDVVVDGVRATSETVTPVAVDTLVIAAGTRGAIASWEDDAACRTVPVVVTSPQLVDGDVVTLTTSAGALIDASGAQAATVQVAASGGAATAEWSPYTLGQPLEGSVTLTAATPDVTDATATVTVAPAAAVDLRLTDAPTSIDVGASGTAADSVRFVLDGQGGQALGDQTVRVVTSALASGSADCEALGASAVDCNPTGLGDTESGSCLLASDQVVAANGRGELPLAAGVCFTGQVDLSFYFQEPTGTATCRRDQELAWTETPVETSVLLTAPAETSAFRDTCADAVAHPHSVGSTSGDLALHTNAISAHTCASGTSGVDAIAAFQVAGGATLDLTLWEFEGDGALVVLDACDPTACVDWAASSDSVETLAVTNGDSATRTYVVVVEGMGSLGAFLLEAR